MNLEQVSQALAQLSATDVETLARRIAAATRRREFGATTTVDLFMTQACNLRCDYCFVDGMRPLRPSEDLVRRMVDFSLVECGEEPKITLCLFGGEPLLERRLMRTAATYARARAAEVGKSVAFDVTTNGTLLDEDAMEFAREFGFRYLVSVDGDEVAHDLHRRRPDGRGSFASVVDKIPLLHRWCTEDAGARVTVSHDTVSRMALGIRRLHALGFNYFQIAPVDSAEWSEDELCEYERQLREVARFYVETSSCERPVRLATFETAAAEMRKGLYANQWGCHAARGRLSVDCEGRIFPCAKFAGMQKGAGMFQLGTLDDGITEWDARSLVANAHPQTRHGCTGCENARYCSGGCLVTNLESTGSMYRPSKVFCAATKAASAIITDMPDVAGLTLKMGPPPEHTCDPHKSLDSSKHVRPIAVQV